MKIKNTVCYSLGFLAMFSLFGGTMFYFFGSEPSIFITDQFINGKIHVVNEDRTVITKQTLDLWNNNLMPFMENWPFVFIMGFAGMILYIMAFTQFHNNIHFNKKPKTEKVE